MKRLKDDEPIMSEEYSEDLEDTGRADVGPGSGGQSGDMQGLSSTDEFGSESIAELLEEGQYYEASVISGIENAAPADESEVRTREVPEGDVPTEYLDQDEPPKND